jgi:hypothetical protein
MKLAALAPIANRNRVNGAGAVPEVQPCAPGGKDMAHEERERVLALFSVSRGRDGQGELQMR